MSRAKQFLVQVLTGAFLVVGSLLISLLLFELLMQFVRQNAVAMRVAPTSYGVFDENLGVRYQPTTSVSYSYLDAKGRVLECLPEISRTNADGFRGRDMRQDYRLAGQRLLASGDSFSHWNNGGFTLVDYTNVELRELGYDTSILNVAGGTFGLEHMVVHLATAIEDAGELKPDLVSIQFINDDITRGWWYRDTINDGARLRTRLGGSVECLSPDSNCGSDEYLIEERATQEWCMSRKGTGVVDAVSTDLVETYREMRGFFVYLPKVFARLGIVDPQSTSVIPRVVSIEQAHTDRISKAIETIKSSGARIVLVYLPTSEEIQTRKIGTFDAIERAVLQSYEDQLGVKTVYPTDYKAFDGITDFAVSPVDSHPSMDLQRGYGRYLATLFSEALE